MADEKKPGWWSSLPGLMTAATGFVAALTGLVAALNQLGLFARDAPARPEVRAVAPATRVAAEAEEHTATAAGESAAVVRPVQTAPPASPPVRPGARPAAVAPADTVRADTVAGRARRVVPARTTLELVTTARGCAPVRGQARLTARLARAVPIGDDTLTPQGLTAILSLRRQTGRNGVEARLDSLALRTARLPVRRAEVTPRRDIAGWCVPAGTRLAAVLGSPVTVPGR